ncbi:MULTISPECIES: ACP S-malonyltransferase [Actinoalloteichus]|uniref:[acyl-carrier-protein] S-malonyltransferase n=1 Tax=Actinoalloteichus fjordicus TaxID=1612552 RepID=A0AAC9PUG8_9PSEU|nr:MULTISPECIES: ACP S-malonyltransferase [Actinoalloteichus]APU17092.1 (acyl-carrier-protein) S-malonyltransferase [Actinoalloteichus fjordicus]APU23173.1 (acyl-carrier-protein) S-malonyltransferase [Actinoalloteichus sp. GBA129-24]
MFSERVIALLAPGQGSQSPGMLTPWLEAEGAREQLADWSEATGLDLVRLGTEADAEEIKDTAVTQPLVVALTLLAAEELCRRIDLPTNLTIAGHSVGELAAAALAGVFRPIDAVRLAAVRGREMADACALEASGMSAVLGGEPDVVLARLAELGLDPANRNGGGQIVAAGPLDALSALSEEPPEGARVRPLAVAGAFHTRFMAPAEEALRKHAESVEVAHPVRPLLSNFDGGAQDDGAEILRRLVAQVTRPVRWDACMATLADQGVTAVVELPPAGALVGLVKRGMKGTKTVPLKTPADLDKAVQVITEHAADADTTSETTR